MSLQEPRTALSGPGPVFGSPSPVAGLIQENVRALRASWFWFLLLGISLVILGLAILSYTGMVWASLATAFVFGCFMVAGGVLYIVGAFFTRCWGGFFLSLLAGVLNLAVGAIILEHPVDAIVVFTLLMAAFFFVEGLFRIIAALAGQFRHWGWMLVNGLITLALGVMIWRRWPFDALYVVGLFLGVDLVISGANYIALALNVRRLPSDAIISPPRKGE
jgi:uncharacterized membrane protein HdeD (DUF308 family)